MSQSTVRTEGDELVVEVRVKAPGGNFFEYEKSVQDALNEAGRQLSATGLAEFDADGSPITVGNTRLTAKGRKVEKNYETPFGAVKLARYAYQAATGGATHIPLEHAARTIGNSTPRFAKLVSSKYSGANAGAVQQDLEETLHRKVSRCFVQDISGLVAGGLRDKADLWETPGDEPPASEVATVAIGLDGACMLFCEEGYRQAMVGTISFLDAGGDRLHTCYVAAAPEYGKGSFLAQMDVEIARVRETYPGARYVGISDGAGDFRPWLGGHATTLVLDFWHLSEYLAEAAAALFPREAARRAWLGERLHGLKHRHGAAGEIRSEIAAALEAGGRGAKKTGDLEKVLRYMENNADRTNYASYRKGHIPIGSGVTEAACKTVVKQRMCGSGMKWKSDGASTVLTLRAKRLTGGAWEQFWAKVGQVGL